MYIYLSIYIYIYIYIAIQTALYPLTAPASLQLHSARDIAAGVRCMLACMRDVRGRHAYMIAAFCA